MRSIVAARRDLSQLAVDHVQPGACDALAVRLRQHVEQRAAQALPVIHLLQAINALEQLGLVEGRDVGQRFVAKPARLLDVDIGRVGTKSGGEGFSEGFETDQGVSWLCMIQGNSQSCGLRGAGCSESMQWAYFDTEAASRDLQLLSNLGSRWSATGATELTVASCQPFDDICSSKAGCSQNRRR